MLRFSGRITIHDILRASFEYEKDSRFDELLFVLADYTQIDECSAEPSDIDEVWAIDMGAKLSNKRLKKAIVTTSPEVIALANRYSTAPDPAFPVRVFATDADARTWLNI